MKSKTIGILALITTITTYLWVTGVILDVILKGPVDNYEQALNYAANPDTLYYLNYINVSLLTILTSMMFAGFYEYYKNSFHIWTTIGILFVPVYCTLNLLAYLSQITIVPRVLAFIEIQGYRPIAELLAALMVQNWDGSAVSVINLLAYATLGIPSIIFGAAMLKQRRLWVVAGVLLAMSGIFSMLAFVGVLLQNATLVSLTLFSGFIYAIALIFITIVFIRSPKPTE
jgi:hypothetical protein